MKNMSNVCSNNQSLNEMIIAYREGKEDAFLAIYDACYGIAKGIYNKKVPMEQQNRFRLDDIFQDSIVKVWEHLDSFDVNKGDFCPWFKTIFWNTYLSEYRACKLHACADLSTIDESEVVTINPYEFIKGEAASEVNPCVKKQKYSSQELIEDKLSRKDTLDEVVNCMNKHLSPQQRDAICMFYFDEMSVEEISKAQGCGINSVKSRLHQGRNKLRNHSEELERLL